MKLVLPILIFANPAFADLMCGVDEEVFMFCQIEGSGKSVSICFNRDTAYYRYGYAGKAAELASTSRLPHLTTSLGMASGGRAIWEEVSFQNDGYTYAVHGGFDRLWSDEDVDDVSQLRFGGVSVEYGGEIILDLDCNRSTVDYTWDILLGNAKNNAGFLWDDRTLAWVAKAK